MIEKMPGNEVIDLTAEDVAEGVGATILKGGAYVWKYFDKTNAITSTNNGKLHAYLQFTNAKGSLGKLVTKLRCKAVKRNKCLCGNLITLNASTTSNFITHLKTHGITAGTEAMRAEIPVGARAAGALEQVTIQEALARGFVQNDFDASMLEFFVKADVPFVTVENACMLHQFAL